MGNNKTRIGNNPLNRIKSMIEVRPVEPPEESGKEEKNICDTFTGNKGMFWLIPISARNKEALIKKMEDLCEWLNEDGKAAGMSDISYTLFVRRSHFHERAVIIARDKEELSVLMKKACNGGEDKNILMGSVPNKRGFDEAAIEKGNRLIEEICTNGEEQNDYLKLVDVANYYIKGDELDWDRLFTGKAPKCLSMPTYPFSRERYWVLSGTWQNKNEFKNSFGKLHSLIGINNSDLKEQKFSTVFDGSEYFISDHVIDGFRILPGAVYLEIARAAGQLAAKNEVVCIKDILWLNPIAFGRQEYVSEEKEVSISLYPVKNGVEYDIWTEEDGQRTVNSQGRLLFGDDKESDLLSKINISEISSRLTGIKGSEECYKRFSSNKINYGNGFKLIRELRTGAKEALAYLEMPSHLKDKHSDMKIHPSVLDAAFQTVAGLMADNSNDGEVYFPFAIDEVEILGAIAGAVCAYAVNASNDEGKSVVPKYDITIADETGNCLVKIKGFMLKNQSKLSSVDEKPEQFDAEECIETEDLPGEIESEDNAKYLEKLLKEVFASEVRLPVSRISDTETFDSFGIDSVMTIGLTRRLEEHFGELPKTLFFEYRTLSELTEYFTDNYSELLKTKFSNVTANKRKPVTVKKAQATTSTISRNRFSVKYHPQENREAMQELDIAIVGLSGRYPMADNLDEFWTNLCEGKDCISEIPPERWDNNKLYNPDRNKKGSIYTKWGGFINDVDKFDPLFFNISPREAELMDPQERIFLETVWHTLEDASYTKSYLDKKKVGVFVGVMYAHYQLFGAEESMKGNLISLGGSYASIANRVSYLLNFHGPSMAVDTMCSSSLTAIHLACDSIRKGESEMAIAGGVNVTVHPNKYVLLSQSQFASTDGRCRSFGQGGDGYVPGEGVGAVLLKPLNKAIEDKDYIYAVIKGSAINHGGRTNGYTVPSPNAQSEVISDALKMAAVNPETISYLEAHGTGTSLGDPIEINGLVKAFGTDTELKGVCSIGSIKSNIGHLESAAGIAALTKVLLQMKYKKLVPSIHSETLNPNINFSKTPFVVQRKLEDWNRPVVLENGVEKVYPRIAGISSFGAGGSNAHLIIEEYCIEDSVNASNGSVEIITLSARKSESLVTYAKELIDFIKGRNENNEFINLRDLAYTLKTGREELVERVAVLVGSLDELIEKLDLFVQGNIEIEKLYRGSAKPGNKLIILDGEAGKAYIEAAIKNSELEKLAALWVEGSKIDWNFIYKDDIPNRIPVPKYPFSRERYWVPTFEENTGSEVFEGSSKLHPMVGRNISDLSEQKYITSLSGKEFYLADHKVSGEMLMPGAAIVEMARAAGELAANRKVSGLANVIWAAPIAVGNDENRYSPVDLFTGIYPASQGIRYEVWTSSSNSDRNIHSQGEIVYDDEDASTPDLLDIQALNGRLVDMIDDTSLYSNFQKNGFDYGKSFRTVKTIRYSKNEALGLVELPFGAELDMDTLELHPSIIDGAFQVVSVITGNENNRSGIYVPFAFDKLKILRPLSKRVWVYAEKAAEKIPDTIKYNLKLFNEDRDMSIIIEGFTAKALKQTTVPLHNTVIFTEKWEKEILDANTPVKAEKYIVLLKDERFEKPLTEELKGRDVLFVKPSDSFFDNRNEFGLNPAAFNDYLRLFDKILGIEPENLNILHIWSDPVISVDTTKINETLEKGINSLFLITKALFEKRVKGKVRLLYVYTCDGDAALPQYASAGAFAKTVGIENPSYFYKTVGMPSDFWSSPEKYLKTLIAEYGSEFGSSREIRISEDNRFEKKMVEQKETADKQELTVKPGGVYLITGGAGGIGLAFAEYISSKQKAVIILSGRSELTSDKKGLMGKIAEKGSEVHYIKSDITRMEDVENLVSEVRRRFKSIDGIIHSAGILKDAFIIKKDLNDFNQVMAPKLYGSIWLDRATREDKLDFFVLFSSVSAVMGNAGQSDYAFANSFMDYFTIQRDGMVKAGKRFGRSVSIAWPLWKEGGMGVSAETEAYMLNKAGIVPLDKEAGFNIFEYAINSSLPYIMAYKGNKTVIRQFFNKQARSINDKTNNFIKGTETDTSGIDQTRVSGFLKKIVSKEIKLSPEKISETEPLENYGIDSVMVMNMTRALEEVFGSLPKTLFFEYQSIKELSSYFISYHKNKLIKEMGLDVNKEAVKNVKIDTDVKSDNLLQSFKNTRFAAFEAQSRLGQQNTMQDIAIIGVNGRYPMANDLDEFWENLKSGKDCITEIPPDRWDYKKYFDTDKDKHGKMYCKWGGFIDDVDKFDPWFFNISPREAKMMDPQERLFMQCIWHTIEDAGYTKSKLWGKNAGVFVGVMYGQYQMLGDESTDVITGSTYASVANRVSYFFNFHGPSIAIDTMCSSSLTAIHLACESIYRGESEIAVAGGVNVTIHPNKYLVLSQGKFAASDGRCKSFGIDGDGYVPGEGVGAVLLKPLSKAVADGDHIYAVIKGSTLNHGGKTNGYTVPNPNAQAELIVKAFEKTGVNPRAISYLEAHGTGTSLGDPIEITAVAKAYEKITQDGGFCAIGSVKSNIGHLESAAGIAGITKILLQMKYGKLVPSIHSETLNPNIDFEKTPFFVQRTLSDWERPTLIDKGVKVQYPRTAGISSFGAGGSNAHIILEEYIQNGVSKKESEKTSQLIVLSAKNKDRLKAYAENLAEFIKKKTSVDTVRMEDKSVAVKVSQDISELVSEIIGADVKEIDLCEELSEYGLDPVSFNVLLEKIGDKFGVKLGKVGVYQYSSINKITEWLMENYIDAVWDHYAGQIDNKISREEEEITLSDIAYTLKVAREAFDERLAFVTESKSDLVEKLEAYSNGDTDGLFCGNIKNDNNRINLFDEDDEIKEIIKVWARKGKTEKLAELWVSGVNFDWGSVDGNSDCMRITLPVYPFAQERCWVSSKNRNSASEKKAIHPLIDNMEPALSFSSQGVVFSKCIKAYEPIVNHHRVAGNSILPGVAYLEMAYAAAKLVKPSSRALLKNVVWLYPLVITKENTRIEIVLKNIKNAINFEIRTANGEKPVIHSKGEITFMANEPDKEKIDILRIKQKCTKKMNGNELYSRFSEIKLEYGDYFSGLQSIEWNSSEAVGTYKLPMEFSAETGAYSMHPTAMDAALQSIAGLSAENGMGTDAPLLPFAVDKVEVLMPVETLGYSYVQVSGKGRFNVAVLDAQGNICIKLSDVVLREMKKQDSKATVSVPVRSIVKPTTIVRPRTKTKGDIEQTIEKALSDVLQINENEFDKKIAYTDFGVDSVLAVEIINILNKQLNINLKSTDLFNYSTIDNLANYIFINFLKDRESGDIVEEFAGTAEAETEDVLSEPLELNENQTGMEELIPMEGFGGQADLSVQDVDIAVIGVAGRFPDAKDLDEFWYNLQNGKNSVREIYRWKEEDYYDPDPKKADKSYSKWMGTLQDIDCFDPLFFNISPREASMMDPQQRIFLMEAWRALEDAGYSDRKAENSRCGVFVGCGSGDYINRMKESNIAPEAYAFMGNNDSILASRISYFLNLKGPSIAVNTACSSSLVAIHLACESIKSGTSDIAIAGGVAILTTPGLHLMASRAGMLSPDGACKSFDDKANGFVPGEGAGAVILKRLDAALRDGDNIYCTIKGTGINQDGRTNGITAPNGVSQTAIEVEVYEKYEINPESIGLVEAHGSGTKLGDPIEVDALNDAFRKFTDKKQFCAIGSVKTNIGHLLTAAGIAGFIKALLCIKNKKLVPTINLENTNEHINFKESPFFANATCIDWESKNGQPRMAAISSFGFSGTNAHIVIEEPLHNQTRKSFARPCYFVPLSAKNEEALDRMQRAILKWIGQPKNEASMEELSFTLSTGRSHFPVRAVFIVKDMNELADAIGASLARRSLPHVFKSTGTLSKSKLDETLLLGGEEILEEIGSEKVPESQYKGKLEDLANIFVKGYDLELEKMFRHSEENCISLPTYPFSQEHCWISEKKYIEFKEKLQPIEFRSIQEREHGIAVKAPKDRENRFYDEFFNTPVWRHMPLNEQPLENKGDSQGVCVIVYVDDAENLALHIAERYNNVIKVLVEGSFWEVNNHKWDIRTDGYEKFVKFIKETGQISDVYFLGGVKVFSESDEDVYTVENSQETGVLALFRLVKVLEGAGLSQNRIKLRVVTNSVFGICEGDAINPYPASVLGFAKSMAKEYDSWNVSVVDVRIDENTSQKEITDYAINIINEPASPSGDETVLRYGRRYRRALEAVKLAANASAFRHKGVYLIVGGAGGIGLEFSKYLAKKVEARVVLVGRSSLSPAHQEKIKEIESLGGKVAYIQADTADEESIRNSVKQAKERFGVINGVIHSAIVLKDRMIRNMDEKTLTDVLRPKVSGSVALYNALKGENLDFMMFFSSAQSFTGNPGQSNYAAACTFKDAYAHFISTREGYPVRIINWGYWGSVGIVASEEYNRKLLAQGIESIEPEEGMEAIERTLSNGIMQVLPLKAKEGLKKSLGIDSSRQLEIFPASRKSVIGSVYAGANKKEATISDLPRTLEAFKELESFGQECLLKVFRDMGVFKESGEAHGIEELKAKLKIVPSYNQLFNQLLRILENAEMIEIGNARIITTKKIDSVDKSGDWGSAEERKVQLTEKFPEIEAHLKLLSICLKRYPDILTGNVPATEVMFPNSSMELVEGVYKGNKAADFYNNLVVECLVDMIKLRLPELNKGEKVRILEVGAGTGGTSAAVFMSIRKFGEDISYDYTDISIGFTKYGRRQYGKENPYVDFKLLNIENAVEEQEYELGSYDAVIATNVLHATKNIGNTLKNIKRLLKTNGLVMVNEATQIHCFSTMTFGLLEGWWVYEDAENRLPGGPLLGSGMWKTVMNEQGFDKVFVLGSMGNEADSGQCVVLGESNGVSICEKTICGCNDTIPAFESVKEDMPRKEQKPASAKNSSRVESSKDDEYVKDEVISHIQDIVEKNLIKILNVAKKDLKLDKQFSEYGVDSISGVDLVTAINEDLEIVLKTTVLFDYANITELTDYIFTNYGDKFTAERSTAVKEIFEQEAQVAAVSSSSEAVQGIDEDGLLQSVERVVGECIEKTLGISAQKINPDKQFAEYGVDSISGLDLINSINDVLGIVLKTTTLFDYPNVKELSLYIYSSYREAVINSFEDISGEKNMDSQEQNLSQLDMLEKLAKGEVDVEEVYKIMED